MDSPEGDAIGGLLRDGIPDREPSGDDDGMALDANADPLNPLNAATEPVK